MTTIRALTVGLFAVLVFAASSAGATPNVNSGLIDEPGLLDCLEPVPSQGLPAGSEDDGREIVLDVHFVLDGVSQTQVGATLDHIQRPFAELGIRIDPTFEEVVFHTDTTFEGRPSIDPVALMNLTREHLGGYRPHGSDVVYTMTSKELVSSGATGGSVAGQADCIGGVRYPREAFSVGEAFFGEDYLDMRNGKIAAHEIAHLLGAHHHYANCAQGNPDDIVADWTPCTLMFNDIALISLRMSSAEAPVVRGHSLAYADNTPTGLPEPIARTLKLRISKIEISGGIHMDDFFEECVNGVEVTIERKTGRGWKAVTNVATDDIGLFSIKTRPRGTYRAVAPAGVAHDGSNWRTCEETYSSVVKAKR